MTRTAFRGMAGWMAVVLLGAATVAGVAGPAGVASAHAALVRSVPERGARLDEPLQQVELTFSEPVEAGFSQLTLERTGGEPVELGPVEAEGETLRARVTGSMPAGDYVLRYRVLSADGHPVEGEVPFSVTAPAPAPSSGGTEDQPAPPPAGGEQPGGTTTPAPGQQQPSTGTGPAVSTLWVGVIAAVVVLAILVTWAARRRR